MNTCEPLDILGKGNLESQPGFGSSMNLINGAEAIGLENFGLEHKVGWHIDDDVVWGVMVLLVGSGHSLRLAGSVRDRLKEQARKFEEVGFVFRRIFYSYSPFLISQLTKNLLVKLVAGEQRYQSGLCIWVKDEGTIELLNNS